ncbi:hypothetical protein [Ohtaekwangia sp.]|uniref:hypothetical protein n=1 Tax=Ohtaekwangia sp. TaxID=2066019 RepID=UPI002F94F78E
MNHRFLIFMAACMTLSVSLFAQGERKDKTAVTYEEIYDEPYSVNKLFVGLMPLYGELFATNVNAGFGAEAVYYHKDKMDFRVQFRKTYSQQFFDFSRDLASKQSSVDNRAEVFNYYEFGLTYHIKDFEESSKTKMFLYKKSYKGDKWAARVPLSADVPCKVRKIYGVRLGGIIWDSSTDVARALSAQKMNNNVLVTAEGKPLPLQEYNTSGKLVNVHPFTNIASKGLYLGGSMSWIKNVAVNFDKFEEGIDDLMITAYADILFAPSLTLDDIIYTNKDSFGAAIAGSTATYSIDPLKTKKLGFRLGLDGRFNRQFGWSYGAEVGYRPALEKRTFYALLKICFPVFGTNLDYKVESFGK